MCLPSMATVWGYLGEHIGSPLRVAYLLFIVFIFLILYIVNYWKSGVTVPEPLTSVHSAIVADMPTEVSFTVRVIW